MTRDITATPEYCEVFAWLRGGDETPDPQMENQFLDLITEAVAERLIAGRKDSDDGFEEYDSLRNEHPDVFRYLTNCFRRYAWTKACIQVSLHISNGSPWADTRKSNPDSWGTRIEDSLIREWFLPMV